MSEYEIRPARAIDITHVHDIFTHYVQNTVISFYYEAPPLAVTQSKFETATARHLPYLVAVPLSTTTTVTNDDDSLSSSSTQVLGYAYASAFRAPLLAYAPSTEISIFVHPSAVARGVGQALMTRLLSELARTRHRASEPGHEREHEHEDDNGREEGVAVRNVFAVMAHDVNGPAESRAQADRLVRWYCRFGFRVVARLENVGFKMGRWLDTVYLQLDMEKWKAQEGTVGGR